MRKQTQTFALTPIAAACAVLAWAWAASPAWAQQGPANADAAGDKDVQSVVGTGFRHSIESSLAIKRDADSIVEAVTAEDIGNLPDVSIAESIARLAGLTAQRVE